ncbi:MAG: S41 family peptidase [Lentimicrobiaceae bacterium]|jgi:carboxyl-terminal processing protease|nr:S41 family peptidase [Lentimicrobiaceae bacterium]MDD4597262.1 S41 family peptidase [Lentimicrobiaceae bacterium]MDY0024567.1 S41 family peptidase [Lentimicrobium sp.]
MKTRSIKHRITNNTLIFVTLIVFTSLLPLMSHGQFLRENPRATVQKFAAMLEIINYYYVDTANSADLTEDAIVAMLKELDPHSMYLSKEDVKKANEPLQGNFEGVGIQFQLFHDTILVVAAVPGGPSDKLGILAGDKIITINGEDATGKKISNNYVMERLRGPKNSKVTVGIKRKGRKDIIDYTIVRDKIPLNSVDASFMVSDTIGYIKLTRFARTSLAEVKQALQTLRKSGMKDLILDLRNNSGGYLDVAIDLSDEFLDNDKLIVYTEGMRSPRTNYKSTSRGSFKQGRIIVMVNEGSASASEIVAGAIQDWDRGLILGRRSFGKGLVQRPFNLPDSSVVRLTTARYYTPSGRCIQKPYDNGTEDYYADLLKRFEHGEFVSADSIKFPDSIKYYTPSKRIVYGGGGIMPDVFIPIDTAANSKYYSDLFRKGLLNEYTIDYLDKHRAELKRKYPTITDFKKNFTITDELFEDFLAFAEKNEVPRDEEGIERSGKEIKTIIKGLIARNMFDVSAYFEVISPIDRELMQAIKSIQDDALFRKLSIAM